MAAFLTSLASIGAQAGEAKDEVRKESEARSNKLREFTQSDAYLDLAKQSEQRQQAEFEQRKKSGDLIEMKDGRIWSVSQGKFIDQQKTDPKVILGRFLQTSDPRIRKIVEPKLSMIAEEYPYDEKEMLKAALSEADKAQTEVQRQDDRAEAERNRQADVKVNREQTETFQREERKSREANQLAVAKIMTDYRLQEKYKLMTPQERQQYESIKALEPMVSRLRGFLENNKMTEENNYIFGDHSALMQHARAAGYKGGVKQEPKTQELIKDAAAISIMGAAPWVRIGRGKYTLEQIQQHLPKQTDTPANMYDKVTWLQDEVMENAKASLAGLEPPGSRGGSAQPAAAGGADPNDPLGILPKAKGK